MGLFFYQKWWPLSKPWVGRSIACKMDGPYFASPIDP